MRSLTPMVRFVVPLVHMLNGRYPGDNFGSYTFCKENGASKVHYFLCTTDLFSNLIDFNVHTRDDSDPFLPKC